MSLKFPPDVSRGFPEAFYSDNLPTRELLSCGLRYHSVPYGVATTIFVHRNPSTNEMRASFSASDNRYLGEILFHPNSILVLCEERLK